MGWHDDIPALRIGVWDRWGLNGSTWKERGASEHTAVHARPKRRFMRVPDGGSCASRTAVHARPVRVQRLRPTHLGRTSSLRVESRPRRRIKAAELKKHEIGCGMHYLSPKPDMRLVN